MSFSKAAEYKCLDAKFGNDFSRPSVHRCVHQGQSYDLNYERCKIKLCPHANVIIIIMHK